MCAYMYVWELVCVNIIWFITHVYRSNITNMCMCVCVKVSVYISTYGMEKKEMFVTKRYIGLLDY